MDNNILYRVDETIAASDSSIRVQLNTGLFLARFRKTPRWQPRGHDTQSFRPLVQEEEVSSGREYSSAACVSTPSSQWQPAGRLTRSCLKGIDTHENEFICPQYGFAGRH